MAADNRVTPDLFLSAADQQNLQAAIRTVLVCSPHASLDEWRVSVQRAVKRVVDGDMVFSYFGAGQFDAVLSEEIGRIREFPGRVSKLVKQFDLFHRSEALGVWNRHTLHQGHYTDFLRSSYYREFARPLRAVDGVGLAVTIRDLHAGLQVHRDSERGSRFGTRETALLQLLYPAFQAGIEIAALHFFVGDQPGQLKQSPDRMRYIPSSSASSSFAQRRAPLTQRELEVVRLLAVRRSNYEIAELLHVSRATAKRHTENILLKLGLHSRREVERVIGEL